MKRKTLESWQEEQEFGPVVLRKSSREQIDYVEQLDQDEDYAETSRNIL